MSEQLRASLHPYGDAIVTFGSLSLVTAYAMEDVLHLRIAALLGTSSFALFYLTRSPPMKTPLAWGIVQMTMNMVMVARIAAERRPVTFSEEELDVYEEHFMPYGCSARSFKLFMDAGKRRKYKAGEIIQPQGETLCSLSLVIRGRVERSVGDKPIPALHSFPGARDANPEGDAGAWIGELGLMRLLNGTVGAVGVAGKGATGAVDNPDTTAAIGTVGAIGATAATDDSLVRRSEPLASTQKLLQVLGFYEGRLDAKLGPKTERALRHFQAAAGLKPDGLVGPKTEATILRVGASVEPSVTDHDSRARLESVWTSRAWGLKHPVFS